MTAVEPKVIRWTRDDYHRIASSGVFDGRRVELIRGEVVEMTPQDSLHATGVAAADRVLQRVFDDRFVVRTQLPLGIGFESEPEPDVAVVRGALRDFLTAHPTEAALVVEISVTSLEHDRTIKKTLYAEANIAEYWIVNLVDQKLEVYRAPGVDGYSVCRTLSTSESITPIACPSRQVAVTELIL